MTSQKKKPDFTLKDKSSRSGAKVKAFKSGAILSNAITPQSPTPLCSNPFSKSRTSLSGASLKASLTNISRTLTGKRNSKLVTVEPSYTAVDYFEKNFNIDLTRSLIQALLEKCNNTTKQSKWLRKLNELINIYVNIVNHLAETLEKLHDAGIHTTHIAKTIQRELRFIDFTTYKTFLEDCESILLSISAERNDIIESKLDVAVADAPRYIKAIRAVGESIFHFKKSASAMKATSKTHMEDLEDALDTFPNTTTIEKANLALEEYAGLKKIRMRNLSKFVHLSLKHAILIPISGLNAAHSTLSLTLLHLLPRVTKLPNFNFDSS